MHPSGTSNGRGTLELLLTVRDPDVYVELSSQAEGRTRHDYALDAMRIGVLAMRQPPVSA